MKSNKFRLITTVVALFLSLAIVVSGFMIFNVFGNDLSFDIPTYNSTYVVGESVTIQDAYVTSADSTQKLNYTVAYPDGRKTDATSVKLDVAGDYTVTYSVNVDGVDYEKTAKFSAVRNMASQFVIEKDCVVTPNVISPENTGVWKDTKDGRTFFPERYHGVQIKATSPLSHLSYNGVINLAELGREKPFFEFMFTPEEMGKIEASSVTIKLTDIYDASNYVTMKMRTNALYGEYQSSLVAQFSASDTYDMIGFREYDFYVFDCPICGDRSSWDESAYVVVDKDASPEIGKYTCPSCKEVTEGSKLRRDLLYKEGDYEGKYQIAPFGTIINSSFYGQYKKTDNYIPLPLYFDNDNPTIWCESKFYWSFDKQWRAFDFNNTDIVGTNLWDGFTTGEVYFDLYIEGTASGANLLVTKVNGVDLSQSVDTITSPTTISMDFTGLTEQELPNGVAGEEYKYRVPEVVAYSPRCGVISNVKASVYYGVERQQIAITNGFFKTEYAGEYVIEYKATDENGNVSTKKVTVSVLPEYETPISYVFDERINNSYSTSTGKVYLYEGVSNGGVGILNTTVKVLLNEDEVELFTDGTLKYFIPAQEGEYKVIYTVSDYIGTNVEFIKNVTVSNDGIPTISNVYIPDAVRQGYNFNLPVATAQVIDENGSLVNVDVEIYVNDEKLDENIYNPSEVGVIEVEYRAVNPNDNQKSTKITKQVQVLGVSEQSFNSSYIYTNGLSYREQTMEFVSYDITDMQKSSFVFANALSSTEAGVQFTFEGNKGIVEKFTVTFIDAHNGNEVAIDVVNVNNIPVAYHNGIRLGEFSGQFSGFNGKELAVYYDGSGYVKDVTNSAIGKVEYTTDGRKFTGFGDSVYVRVDFYNAQSNTVLEIRKIGNQPIYEDVGDWCVPSLYFEQTVSSLVAIEVNTQIIVPKAKAFDVMGEAQIPTVTIDAPDGSIIVKNHNIDVDYTFTATQFGNYKVTYYVSDGLNEGKAQTIVYKVIDTTAPTISNAGVDKLIYEVGDTFKVPKFDAEDNFDSEDAIVKYVLICDYEDMYRIVEESYTFTTVGKYRIRFCAVDSSYNLSYKEIIVYCV